MARLFLLLIICLIGETASSQGRIGIGTNAPHPSSSMDITSNGKGFLLPRMSTSAREAIKNPVSGLLVYDTTHNRLYQFKDGEWKYMLTNANWSQQGTRNWLYNNSDSVGIGLSSPTERLDVNGVIESSGNMAADENIIANGDLSATTAVATSIMTVNGAAAITDNISSYGALNLSGVGSTVQLQAAAVKKAFFQINGNDLRLGTNSSNEGDIIFRMNGTDCFKFDRFANITPLQLGVNSGNAIIGPKLARASDPEINMLPVVFGLMLANGGDEAWMSPIAGGWERLSTGVYEVTNLGAPGVNFYMTIVVTPHSPLRVCTARYYSSTKFRIEVFDLNGNHADGAFTYVVNSPVNL